MMYWIVFKTQYNVLNNLFYLFCQKRKLVFIYFMSHTYRQLALFYFISWFVWFFMASSLLCSHLSKLKLQWIAKEPVYDIQLEPTLENYLYTLDNATCKFSRMPLSVPAKKKKKTRQLVYVFCVVFKFCFNMLTVEYYTFMSI